MLRNKVDPAAMLLAVFAVGAAPLMESGLWSLFNTIVSGIVLFVIICVMWPRKADVPEEVPDKGMFLALMLVVGFIATIFWAWPVQGFLGGWLHGTEDQKANAAVAYAIIPGLITTAFIWARYRRRIGRPQSRSTGNQADDSPVAVHASADQGHTRGESHPTFVRMLGAVRAPYKIEGKAKWFKAVIHMLVGIAVVLAVARIVWMYRVDFWVVNSETAERLHAFQVAALSPVAAGLVVAAAVELGYTLFTEGPDEALNPVMLALAGALILQLAQFHQPDWKAATALTLSVLGLAGLFAIRKWLADIREASDRDDAGQLYEADTKRMQATHSESQPDGYVPSAKDGHSGQQAHPSNGQVATEPV